MFSHDFDIFNDTSALPIEKTHKINHEPKQTYITNQFIIDRTRHEVSVPIGTEYSPIETMDEFPYKKYPFTLDTFQKIALTSLHLNHSVLVSAHTSAGKTVIAEYAIAMSLKNKQRVIYTSPIKALSNQKYRELQEEFGDVGLVTGDVTLNPNASCLVMTTEILRNMLYRGSEVMREVKWIIFDEIHYIKEKERGVVWEECIIMAPKDCRMVFLSATVPNADEFAEWVSEIKNCIVHVVYTEKRPTPLEHFLAIKGNGLTKILFEKINEEKKDLEKRINCIKKEYNQIKEVKKINDEKKDSENKKDEDKLKKNIYKNEDVENKKELKKDGVNSKKIKDKNEDVENKKELKKDEDKSKKFKDINDDYENKIKEVKKDKDKNFEDKIKEVIRKDDKNVENKDWDENSSEEKLKKRYKLENKKFELNMAILEEEIKIKAISTNFFDKKAFAACMKNLNGRQRVQDEDVKSVVENLIKQDCLPVIVFSFSRKECEKYALSINEDFLTDVEKDTINLIYKNALMNLREEDRNLPLITNMLPMLLRGTGIHHSGLLPIIKEIVEILFQEGLIKVLFATETFSIGLNMPARSVVFTNISKFDGEERRILSSGEYIQMSGRAGRRGIDSKGMVIAMLSEAINIKKAENLFSGLADKLVSAFRLSYNMILNLMRVEGLDTLYLLERSFYHYQSKRGREEIGILVTELKEKVDKIKSKRKTIEDKFLNENINFYYFDDDVLNIDNNDLNLTLLLSRKNSEFRLHLLEDIRKLHPLQIYNFLIVYEKIRVRRNKEMKTLVRPYLENGRIVNLFVPRNGSPFILYNAMVKDVSKKEITVVSNLNRNLIVKKFPIEYVDKVFDVRVKNLKGLEIMNKKGLRQITLNEMIDCSKENLNEIKNTVDIYNDLIYTIEQKLFRIKNKQCYYCDNFLDNTDCLNERCFDENDLNEYFNDEYCKESDDVIFNLRKIFMEEKYIKKYYENLSYFNELNEIYHMDECKKMIQVLRRLEYCDENTVLTKGRVACEISTGDELLLTEMMFNGDFISLPVEEVVPLLSCIVFPEWDNDSTLSETNNKNYQLLKSMLEKITTVMKNCGIDIDITSVLKKYSFELMDIVELWVRGFSFIEICNRTSVFEGTIIRCFRRLEELLKQMCAAARNIGNSELENLFAMGISKIKRDIVFASSLYL